MQSRMKFSEAPAILKVKNSLSEDARDSTINAGKCFIVTLWWPMGMALYGRWTNCFDNVLCVANALLEICWNFVVQSKACLWIQINGERRQKRYGKTMSTPQTHHSPESQMKNSLQYCSWIGWPSQQPHYDRTLVTYFIKHKFYLYKSTNENGPF